VTPNPGVCHLGVANGCYSYRVAAVRDPQRRMPRVSAWATWWPPRRGRERSLRPPRGDDSWPHAAAPGTSGSRTVVTAAAWRRFVTPKRRMPRVSAGATWWPPRRGREGSLQPPRGDDSRPRIPASTTSGSRTVATSPGWWRFVTPSRCVRQLGVANGRCRHSTTTTG